ncbi:MAG: hypothetical protein IPG07_10475 [Crocinitomicaceae bacterium]|nr:hypothetical protein [Crocinitomicaceae bacterium]
MSAQPNIRLSEELETLAAYIRLKQMMLDGDFIYEEKFLKMLILPESEFRFY